MCLLVVRLKSAGEVMRACDRCFQEGKLVGVRKKYSWYADGWWKNMYECVCGHFWVVKRKVEDVSTEITS